MPPGSPDALDADLLRVGIITLRLAGEACVRAPLTDGLHESIRITTSSSNTHKGSLKSV